MMDNRPEKLEDVDYEKEFKKRIRKPRTKNELKKLIKLERSTKDSVKMEG